MTSSANFHARAYGCLWRSELPLSLYQQASAGAPDIELLHVRGEAPERKAHQRSEHAYRAADGMRYLSGDGVVMDSFLGDRAVLYTAPEWTGEVPRFFYGTMTSGMLTYRGLVPLHGTAVELDGEGVVICGPSGAGKSSVAASLLLRGAKLISDDLTVLDVSKPLQPPMMSAGRRHLRLYPAIAEALAEALGARLAPSHEGKLAVLPPCVDASQPVPLRHVLLLGDNQVPQGVPALVRTLESHLFRPRTVPRLPGHPLRLARLRFVAQHLLAHTLPAAQVWSRDDLERVADSAVRYVARVPVK